jgi:hypothetical protein
MSKKSVIPAAGGSVLPKVIGTLVIIALLVVVVKYPADSAEWVKGIGGIVATVVDGIASFFRAIAS